MNPIITPINILCVGVGASLGAWLRWWLGLRLNAWLPDLPMGTLGANLIGGYVIGLALAAVMDGLAFSTPLRLLIMTGFCGGLTTFSTFSAETVSLMAAQKWGWAMAAIAAHVGGSLLATTLGIVSMRMLRSWIG